MCFQWSSESVSTPQLSVFPMPPVNLPLCYSWHTQAVRCRSRRTWNLLFTAFYGRATVNSALGRETPQSRSHPTYIPKSIALRWSTAQTNLLMCKTIHYCTNQPTIVQNNPLERERHCTHFDIGAGLRNIAGRWFLSIHCSPVSYHSVPMPPMWRPATQPHHHSSLLSNSFSINHFLLTFCLDPYISQHCAFKYALINVMNNDSIGNVRFYWFVALFSDHSHWWEDIMLGVGWGWCAKQMGDKLGCEGVCMVDGCVWGGRWCLIWFSVSNDDLCAQKEMGKYGLMVE